MANNNDTITVDKVEKIMQDQLKEAWNNSFDNPQNYDAMRKILDDLGM